MYFYWKRSIFRDGIYGLWEEVSGIVFYFLCLFWYFKRVDRFIIVSFYRNVMWYR